MISKDDPNHERIVKTPIGVYKKVCLFARSLVYISLRVSGCPVCTFCILFLKTFTKRRFRDYSAITVRLQAITVRLQAITVRLQAITGIYLCVGSAGRTFTNETMLFYS
jgi:hypothetical protein